MNVIRKDENVLERMVSRNAAERRVLRVAGEAARLVDDARDGRLSEEVSGVVVSRLGPSVGALARDDLEADTGTQIADLALALGSRSHDLRDLALVATHQRDICATYARHTQELYEALEKWRRWAEPWAHADGAVASSDETMRERITARLTLPPDIVDDRSLVRERVRRALAQGALPDDIVDRVIAAARSAPW